METEDELAETEGEVSMVEGPEQNNAAEVRGEEDQKATAPVAGEADEKEEEIKAIKEKTTLNQGQKTRQNIRQRRPLS